MFYYDQDYTVVEWLPEGLMVIRNDKTLDLFTASMTVNLNDLKPKIQVHGPYEPPMEFVDLSDATTTFEGDTFTIEIKQASTGFVSEEEEDYRECSKDYCGGGREQCCCECAGCDEQPWFPWNRDTQPLGGTDGTTD